MKAKKKPIVIEYYPCEEQYIDDILELQSDWNRVLEVSIWDNWVVIDIWTLEWVMKATKDDVIIKWVNWELYPCKKEIFEKTYDLIEENE